MITYDELVVVHFGAGEQSQREAAARQEKEQPGGRHGRPIDRGLGSDRGVCLEAFLLECLRVGDEAHTVRVNVYIAFERTGFQSVFVRLLPAGRVGR